MKSRQELERIILAKQEHNRKHKEAEQNLDHEDRKVRNKALKTYLKGRFVS